ncbi:MAG: heme o synthase [Halobacteria archaeon]
MNTKRKTERKRGTDGKKGTEVPNLGVFPEFLASATFLTYVVILTGATLAVTRVGHACKTWPSCNGYWTPPVHDTAMTIAWGYRVLVILTGVLVVYTGYKALRSSLPRRIKYALTVASILYPIQIGVGAAVATGSFSGSVAISGLHLVVAMSIFTALLLSLTWTLEAENPRSPIKMVRERKEITEGRENYGKITAYYKLMKPKLMWLLCLVAVAAIGMAAAVPGNTVTWVAVAGTLLGGVLSIGASGTFNNVLERERDAEMARTADRPIVNNEVAVRNAVAFGLGLTVLSFAVFYIYVNLLAAILGMTAILFYSVVYTLLLKPHTTQNIVIGGAVGALPALIGWAAVTDSIGLPALVLGGVIFAWTPAHFYNLALAYKRDYERGGFPMLPVVEGDDVTLRHILFYLGATFAGASILGAVTPVGWTYVLLTTTAGAVFVYMVINLYRKRTDRAAMRSFHASNLFLGILLISVIIDTVLV